MFDDAFDLYAEDMKITEGELMPCWFGFWIQVHPFMRSLHFMQTVMMVKFCKAHACSMDGISIVLLVLPDGQELVVHDIRYVPGIRKSILFVGQLDIHGCKR